MVIFPRAPQTATYQDYGYGQPYTPPQDAAYEQGAPQPEPSEQPQDAAPEQPSDNQQS